MSNPNDERILSVEHNGNVTYLSREDVQRAYDTILETAVTEYSRLIGILRRNVRESRTESAEMSVPLLQQQQHHQLQEQHSQQQQQQQQHHQYIPISGPYYGMHYPLQRESSLQYQQLQLPEVYETNRGNSELLPQSTSDNDEWQYDESIESVHDEDFGFRFSPWRFTCARDVLFGDVHISRETHFVPIVPSSSEDTPSADEFTSETGSLSPAAAEVQRILFHDDLSSEDSENLETSECSEISECQETSEILEASENLETSECSEDSVTSECSNSLECLQISECPETSVISETSECSEIAEVSENLETSECSEDSVTSECSNSLECLQISECPETSVISETSECSEYSVTSECSNSLECLQISECSEDSDISDASENLETSECSEDSVTSGCSNSSESPRTSEISEDSVTSEISEDSETSECSEDSGNSEGSEASEVSDSFQASSRVAEVGRTNDLQYIVYSFSEESSSSSLSERTYWPELEFEMDEMATSAFEFYLRQREEMLRPRRRRM
ncbi:hypothetical protein T08_171 [Trichinella sp. T8]|nr:hypothetical protein T08_171 [Trichinella sp. T8]